MTLIFDEFDLAESVEGYGTGALLLAGRGTGVDVGALGAGQLVLSGSGSGEQTAGIGLPEVPANGSGKLRIAGSGSGSEVLFGAGAGRAYLKGVGTGDGASFGAGKLILRAEGAEMAPVTQYGFFLKATLLMQGFANTGYGLIRDGVAMVDPLQRLYTAMIRSVANLYEAKQQRYSGSKVVEDMVATGEGLSWIRFAAMEERLVVGTEIVGDARAFGRVISRMILADKAANYAEAVATLKEALTLLSFEQALTLALVADDVELETQLATRYLLVSRVLDRLILDADPLGDFQMVALVADAVLLDQIEAGTVDMVALLRDSVGLTLNLSFDDGQYIAWVINTESAGLSRYTNYPFNSFMRIGNRYFGVHHGGVVELTGDDDMGNPISAKLRFGMFDFNDRHEKTFSDAFIGAAADGTLVLKAIFVNRDTGEKNMAIYKVNYRPAASSRETRAKLGRGVQAVDFDFVLENVDGAYFDLKSIQFNPMMGSRRTRG